MSLNESFALLFGRFSPHSGDKLRYFPHSHIRIVRFHRVPVFLTVSDERSDGLFRHFWSARSPIASTVMARREDYLLLRRMSYWLIAVEIRRHRAVFIFARHFSEKNNCNFNPSGKSDQKVCYLNFYKNNGAQRSLNREAKLRDKN